MLTTLEQALQIVLNNLPLVGSENVGLIAATGRVLAQDVIADIHMPPFDKTAMDGFACRMEDIGNVLEVITVIAAGEEPLITIGSHQCAKIMTGAKMPKGADCVLMIEDTQAIGERFIRFVKEKTSRNICYLGEDVQKDALVLQKSILIQPQHIAVLATFGCAQPLVSQKVRIAIMATGDELVEPENTPSSSQIRNSNAWQLMAQAARLPVEVHYPGIIQDQEIKTFEAVINVLKENDLLIITGGISMGDYDRVPDALLRAGFRFHFRSLAVQPGRPTIFATNPEGKVCFALPGNPVSSFNQFELLVKPAIYRMMGHEYQPTEYLVSLAQDYHRKKSERLTIIPVRINQAGEAEVVEYHGSAHINALTHAQAMMFVLQGVTHIVKGEKVRVRQI